MEQFEREWESRLADLERDSKSACTFLYTELTLHFLFGSDFAVRDRVNTHAGFWNGVLGALQAAGFVAIGRMYDDNRKDGTIEAFLRFAEEHPGIFRPAALRERRTRAGMSAEDARAYVADAIPLKRGDLSPLRSEFEKHRAIYEANVEAIRHGIFAHAGRLDRVKRDQLFTRVFLRDLESMAVFPLQLHRALWHLYMNGRAPLLEFPPTNTADIVDKHLPGKSHSTWEHLHVVKNTIAFVAWMKEAPLPPSPIPPELIASLRAAMERDDSEQDGQPDEDQPNGDS